MRCAVVCLAVLVLSVNPSNAGDKRPNIVFILVDDLRFDDIACMGHPFVKTPSIDRLAREGMAFRKAYTTAPLCSPSRASILTGFYPHAHAVRDNTDRSPQSHQLVTFLRLLQEAGYRTAFIGKWHMGLDDSPRPGIDHWMCVKGQGQYFDPEMNVNGQRQKLQGYATDLFNAHAVDFIRKKHDHPFVLYLSHKAVHPNLIQRADGSITDPTASNFTPAPRHEKLYTGAKIRRRPSADIDKLEGKPALMRQIGKLPPLSRETGTSDEIIRDRLRMLMAVEEGVGAILKALEEKSLLDDTMVVFTSDHGYFYGEHGLSVERRLPYEENSHIPLLVRYPPLVKAGREVEEYVLTIDFAPTFLDIGGAKLPDKMHGRSLLPWLKGERPKEWRDSFLMEYYSDHVFERMDRMGYRAVCTKRWKYIQYTDLEGMDELYDLREDPFEMRNLIGSPGMNRVVDGLKGEMTRLLRASGGDS